MRLLTGLISSAAILGCCRVLANLGSKVGCEGYRRPNKSKWPAFQVGRAEAQAKGIEIQERSYLYFVALGVVIA